ncbi:hypothetical protein D3C74_235250 [compost metagenome]
MAKSMRRGVFYVVLLAAGVSLGMQLAESGTGSVYGPAWNQGNVSSLNPNPVGNVSASGTANPLPEGQQQYIGMNNGTSPYNGFPASTGNTSTVNPQQVTPSSQTPADLLLPAPGEPAVDRFADKTAHLLQQASRRGIHWFASLFDASTD